MANLAMISRAMLCPFSGPDKLDRTLNPLGLRLGDDKFTAYKGTVVGTLIINTVLWLVVFCSALFIGWRIRRKYRRVQAQGDSAAPVPPLNKVYLMSRARFGWLVVPFGFTYGGACVGCFCCLAYSSMLYKGFALLVLLSFVVFCPVYIYMVTTAASVQCEYHSQLGHRRLRWFFWGNEEWAPVESDATKAAWAELNHLIFDGYLYRYRRFMLVEIAVMMALGALTAWQPTEHSGCYARAWTMLGVLVMNLLTLVLARPYIAPYEDLMESSIVLVEVAMMVATVSAMYSEEPHHHWGLLWLPHLARAAMAVTFMKFGADTIIFYIDEYETWKSRGGDGSAVAYIRYLLLWSGLTSRAHLKRYFLGYPESPSAGDPSPKEAMKAAMETTNCSSPSEGEAPTTISPYVFPLSPMTAALETQGNTSLPAMLRRKRGQTLNAMPPPQHPLHPSGSSFTATASSLHHTLSERSCAASGDGLGGSSGALGGIIARSASHTLRRSNRSRKGTRLHEDSPQLRGASTNSPLQTTPLAQHLCPVRAGRIPSTRFNLGTNPKPQAGRGDGSPGSRGARSRTFAHSHTRTPHLSPGLWGTPSPPRLSLSQSQSQASSIPPMQI
eukprot:TRINITY_DN18637_c0_g1_i1.p1 TRINITY_DN18637_c0_g1~~TRINITY_DN18637_c0_g1_i1.p1  ORF type:complete len:713 (+),score=130.09 TRINITY_DN18637_c0_g1_i1:305-2140(+)